MTNIYECKRCVENQKFSKDKKIFKGTRKDVRKHLRESHGVKGSSGEGSGHKKLSTNSSLTKNTISP